MATHQYLTVEEHGPVRLVTLNRPEAFNAADEALHGELATVWPELEADRRGTRRGDHGRGPSLLRRG